VIQSIYSETRVYTPKRSFIKNYQINNLKRNVPGMSFVPQSLGPNETIPINKKYGGESGLLTCFINGPPESPLL